MSRRPTLDYLIKKSDEDPGIYIKEFPVGTAISVKTASDSLYYMDVINPTDCLVEIQGDGNWFNVPTKVRFGGSVISHLSSSIKLHWIGLGWCMEIHTLGEKPERIVTSYVKEVYIDGVQILPEANKYPN